MKITNLKSDNKSYNLDKLHKLDKSILLLSAFTLIEILIVILIIGILSTIILSQYVTATRSAKLSALIDELSVEIKAARDKTVSGHTSTAFPTYTCYGISLYKDGTVKDAFYKILGSYQADTQTCVFTSGQGYLERINFEKPFEVNKIFTDNDGCADGSGGARCNDEMIFYFMPPEGQFSAVRRGYRHVTPADQAVRIEIGLPGKDLTSIYVKRIDVSYPTGKIEVEN